ncbi:MAG TPA: hypothetical protein VFH08_02535 [Chitinophagaceae bacterium]|nr:hypothetical protein [Chitinophagaceae bacterium]
MKRSILFILAAFLIIASCSKSGGGDGTTNGGGGGGGSTSCAGVPSSFAANVNPIIQSTCATDATCHGAGSANGPGPLLTYAQITNARAAIKVAVGNGTMPKTGSLTAAQKSTIICWVDSGGPNN